MIPNLKQDGITEFNGKRITVNLAASEPGVRLPAKNAIAGPTPAIWAFQRIQIAGWLIQSLICISMVLSPHPTVQAQDSRTAVLETRANQIDQHIASTDASVQRLSDTVEIQREQLSEMQGEERAAFALLTLLTAGNFVVQVARKRQT